MVNTFSGLYQCNIHFWENLPFSYSVFVSATIGPRGADTSEIAPFIQGLVTKGKARDNPMKCHKEPYSVDIFNALSYAVPHIRGMG